MALAPQTDFLVVIRPGGAVTRKLIDANVLAALGPTGCLVNVARGSVIDETALIAAWQAGTIAGSASAKRYGQRGAHAAHRQRDEWYATSQGALRGRNVALPCA
jgi:lactate dehydrogenase-like 2-hydroxyacid dehydrogenase